MSKDANPKGEKIVNFSILNESMSKKGGQNPRPSNPKPNFSPPPQKPKQS